MQRSWVAAFFAWCCGCSSSQLGVYSETKLNDAAAIAIGAWNTALERGPCPHVRLYALNDADAEITAVVGGTYGYMGYTQDREIVIDLSRHRTPASLAVTMAHELGHALGAYDVYDAASRDDLMYWAPKSSRGPEPTGWDVARVCEEW